jgi:hypothetical protein
VRDIHGRKEKAAIINDARRQITKELEFAGHILPGLNGMDDESKVIHHYLQTITTDYWSLGYKR